MRRFMPHILQGRYQSKISRNELENIETRKWNKNIQLIRGLAVTLVVISHFAQVSILGDYGVDLFFVISGYLISSMLAGEYSRSGRIDVAAFLIKRVKRLVPAAYLVIAVIIGLSYFGLIPGIFNDYLKLGLGYCLYVGNVFGLLPNSSSTTASGLGHFWTLATEMQLYFFWCIIFIPILLKFRFRLQIYILGTSLLIFFPAIAYITQQVPQTIVQRTVEVFAMFVLGNLFYVLHQRFDFIVISLITLFILAISMLILFAVLTNIENNKVFSIYADLFLVGLAYQILFTFNLAFWTKFLVSIGDFSYSLYLIHWPVFLVVGGNSANLFSLMCGIVASFGLSILSFKYIEMLFWKPKRT
jgi:peptidoglycan/LPS O-acetylase OafA/YrhL